MMLTDAWATILVMQNELFEAFNTLTEARRKFLDFGYPLA